MREMEIREWEAGREIFVRLVNSLSLSLSLSVLFNPRAQEAEAGWSL